MTKHETADIVVIGGGAAGMVATVKAAELGDKVVLFEKARRTGGAANFAQGPFGVETRIHRKYHSTLTKEQCFKEFMDFTHWSVDAKLVKNFIDKSGSTIDWLETLGIKFRDPIDFHDLGHVSAFGIIGGAIAMIKILNEKARELGANVYLHTPAKKIIKEGNKVVGVIAEDDTSETIQVDTKAVIISTGGFGANREWIKKYFGYDWGVNLFSHRIPGLAGDGLRIAWGADAAESEMNMVWGLDLPKPYFGPYQGPDAKFASTLDFSLFYMPHLMVNLQGERFCNEEIYRDWPLIANAIRQQKNLTVFMLFDEETRQHYDRRNTLNATIKQAQEKGYTHVMIADSLEDLCEKTGIDSNGFRKTAAEYNNFCEAGSDGLFYKQPLYLKSFKNPPFYCGRFFVSGSFGTLGGIKINHNTETMTKDQDIIPGLYAAGSDANSLYAGTYPLFMAGNLIGFATTSGRIAAENAVAYIKNLNE
jgi:fumarate reductase flavoprotein subunit